MSWGVSEQAIAAMLNTASHMGEVSARIRQEIVQLQGVFEDCEAGLGAHSEEISRLLDTMKAEEQEGSRLLKKFQLRLQLAAFLRQKHLEENPYGGHAGSSAGGSGGAGSGAGAGIAAGAAGGSAAGSTAGGADSFQGAIQTSHKSYIVDYESRITAVQEDILKGSNQNVSRERAKEMLDAVMFYTSEMGYGPVRDAYNNPNAPAEDIAAMHAVDDYIKGAPKWKGCVFRGIGVSREVAARILSNPTCDMLGPSSWSSEQLVAKAFADRGIARNEDAEIRIIFVLDDNKSGASVCHIGTFDGNEAEVSAPSGVIYSIDRVRKVFLNDEEYIFIDVHE